MDFGSLKKLRFEFARDAVGDLDLTEESATLLKSNPTTPDFLASCVEQGLFMDAIRVMAIALPRREAAWWACLNARAARKEDDPPSGLKALEAAERWVFKPTEENRVKAFEVAEIAGFSCPESYAALAVFWSGGSMAPPEAAVVVPPGDALTGTAAAAAVLLAAAREPKTVDTWYRQAMEQAVDIAKGGSGRIG
jgi:hypothetical protein